jgi:hypothetical protein
MGGSHVEGNTHGTNTGLIARGIRQAEAHVQRMDWERLIAE